MNYIKENLFLILTVIWIITGIYWVIAGQKIKKAKKKEDIRFRVFYMFFWVAPVLITFFNAIPTQWLNKRLYIENSTLNIVAFILAIVSLAFMVWSRVVLGENWSGRVAIKENHNLITSGPYRYVRHPMYTGFIFAFLWSAVLLGEVRGLISFIILIIGIVIKLRMEERFVREAFGEEYIAYAKRVKKIVPLIY
ncbi:MAG: methyltransferase family protein [Marinirhabdus sp.]